MTLEEVLLTANLVALSGMFGWCLKLQLWQGQHHKDCHSTPIASHAALEQRVIAAEATCARLAKNAHDLNDVVAACVINTAVVLKHLGMPHGDEIDIPAKLRKLADQLENPD